MLRWAKVFHHDIQSSIIKQLRNLYSLKCVYLVIIYLLFSWLCWEWADEPVLPVNKIDLLYLLADLNLGSAICVQITLTRDRNSNVIVYMQGNYPISIYLKG